MKKLFPLIMTGFLGIAVLAGGMTVYLAMDRNSASKKLQAEEATIPERTRILALGRLEPSGEILAIAGPTGERIARLDVREGDWVKSKQILAYLEAYEVQKSQRDLAASRVAEIEKQLNADTAAAAVQIEQSYAQLQQVDAPQLLETQSQRARLRAAEAELASATRTRDRYRQLYNQGAVSRQSLDDQELAVRQAQESVNQAQETLNQLLRSRETNLQKAEVDLKYSQANLDRVRSQSRLESAIQELKLAEAQLERTLIRSPRAGRVLKIFAHPGEAISQQGVLNLGDTRTMFAVAEVYETDVRFVKVGQKATITSPAFTQSLTGRVSQIGQFVFKNNLLSDDPAARSDVRVVEVKVQIDQSELVASLSQLQVDVQIDLDSGDVSNVP